MQATPAARADRSGRSERPITTRSMLRSFTGLIPVALSIPVLLAHQYTLGIVENLVLTVVVIAYRLRNNQGLTVLDALPLLFGLVTAVLHWGLHDDAILQHLGTAIYGLLLAQIALARLRGESWTTQFAKRSIDPSRWTTEAFIKGNAFVSGVWGGVLLLCLLCSVAPFAPGVVQLGAPLVLLLGTAALTPRLGRWYGARVTAGQAPASVSRSPRA